MSRFDLLRATKDGGWICNCCGKIRNSLRSIQRHIKREHKRKAKGRQ